MYKYTDQDNRELEIIAVRFDNGIWVTQAQYIDDATYATRDTLNYLSNEYQTELVDFYAHIEPDYDDLYELNDELEEFHE